MKQNIQVKYPMIDSKGNRIEFTHTELAQFNNCRNGQVWPEYAEGLASGMIIRTGTRKPWNKRGAPPFVHVVNMGLIRHDPFQDGERLDHATLINDLRQIVFPPKEILDILTPPSEPRTRKVKNTTVIAETPRLIVPTIESNVRSRIIYN